MTQYLACKFRSADKRTYTYRNDGPPVFCGDVVAVPDRSGDGWQRVTVHEIDYIPPPYETKAILGLADDLARKDEEKRDWLPDGDEGDLFGGKH